MFSIMQQVKLPIFLIVVMGDLLHNVLFFFTLLFSGILLILVILHTYSPPILEKMKREGSHGRKTVLYVAILQQT